MKKSIKPILKYFAEVIVVAFGVFLGFYLNTLNSNKEHQQEKEQTLNLIIEELETNKKITEDYVEFHEDLKEQLSVLDSILTPTYLSSNLFEDGGKFRKRIKNSIGFFTYAKQSNSAFETGKISGIFRDFDLNIMQEISSIYQMQNLYVDLGKFLQQKGINLNSASTIDDFMFILLFFTGDGLEMEKELHTNQEELIQKLKQYQKEL